MRLGSLSGRPVVHGIWGRIAGWIYDVWLDFRNARVAAFEICERDWMQSKCVEPFALQRSVRYGFGIDADPDKWKLLERDVHWASVRNIQDVTVVSADGDWTCIITDADCDPRTWEIRSFRIKRRWWDFCAPRDLAAARIVDGGSDALLLRPG